MQGIFHNQHLNVKRPEIIFYSQIFCHSCQPVFSSLLPAWTGWQEGWASKSIKTSKKYGFRKFQNSALAVCNVGFYNLFRGLNGVPISHHISPQELYLLLHSYISLHNIGNNSFPRLKWLATLSLRFFVFFFFYTNEAISWKQFLATFLKASQNKKVPKDNLIHLKKFNFLI